MKFNKFKVKPIEVEVYKQGECFICKNPTEDGAFAHYHCALAYEEHRQLKLKQLEVDKYG